MKKLDQYIKDNRAAFEEEPAAGHYGRFQEKLARANSKRKIIVFAQLAVAASIAVLLSIGFFSQRMPGDNNNRITVCENADNMQSCYLSKIDDAAAEIQALTEGMDSWSRITVTTEVENIVRSANDIASLLPNALSEEESNGILSGYYQNSLESLQTIAQVVNENSNQ